MTNKQQVRIGLIGDGKVAHLHAQALQGIPQAALLAVCGVLPERVQMFAAQYNLQAYLDITQMIHTEALNAVVICTPHPTHASAALAAIEAGVHILVEKPLAASLKDCDTMIAAAETAGVTFGMVSQRRFYAPVQRMRQAIDAGKIGQPVLGMVQMLGWRDEAYYQADDWRGTWHSEGGGVLVNQASHQLDLFQWFMGEIDELNGYWANLNHPYIEVEDTAVAILRFKSGAIGNIVVSNSQKPGLYGKVHVHGSNGASVGVQTDGGAMFIAGMSEITEPPLNDLWTIPDEADQLPDFQAQDTHDFRAVQPTVHFHRLQDADFVDAILTNREPLVTGREGRVTVELFTAIYRSQRNRAPVSFPVAADDGIADFDGRMK